MIFLLLTIFLLLSILSFLILKIISFLIHWRKKNKKNNHIKMKLNFFLFFFFTFRILHSSDFFCADSRHKGWFNWDWFLFLCVLYAITRWKREEISIVIDLFQSLLLSSFHLPTSIVYPTEITQTMSYENCRRTMRYFLSFILS